MKRLALVLVFLLTVATAHSQTPASAPELPPATVYAGRPLLLVAGPPQEGVMPMLTKDQQLAYVPISSIKQAMDAGSTPIRFGDVLALLGRFVEENNRLKAENERLWRIAEKPSGSSTVVVQPTQPAPPCSQPG